MAKITVLGSGTAVSSFYKPFDFRAPPGYLLEHDGKQYLIECSDGIRGQLEKIKIDYFNTYSIFVIVSFGAVIILYIIPVSLNNCLKLLSAYLPHVMNFFIFAFTIIFAHNIHGECVQ